MPQGDEDVSCAVRKSPPKALRACILTPLMCHVRSKSRDWQTRSVVSSSDSPKAPRRANPRPPRTTTLTEPLRTRGEHPAEGPLCVFHNDLLLVDTIKKQKQSTKNLKQNHYIVLKSMLKMIRNIVKEGATLRN